MATTTKAPRGFAAMDPQRQREISALGGRAAHRSGNAHEFDSREAALAGAKSRAARQAQQQNAATARSQPQGASAAPQQQQGGGHGHQAGAMRTDEGGSGHRMRDEDEKSR